MIAEKKKKMSKGQALIETALVTPILVLLLMGIIDFGLMFNNYLIVGNAAREGARNAAVGYTNAEITTIVNNAAGTLDPDKLTTTIRPVDEKKRYPGDEISVTVDYEYSLITPIISRIVSSPVDLSSTTVMRLE